jgi:hypothetical protein
MQIMMQNKFNPTTRTHTKTPVFLVNEDYDAKTNRTQNKDTHTKTPILLVNEDYDAKTNSTQHLLEWVGLLFFPLHLIHCNPSNVLCWVKALSLAWALILVKPAAEPLGLGTCTSQSPLWP